MKTRIILMTALLLLPGTLVFASPYGVPPGLSINLPGFGLNIGPTGFGLNIGLPWAAQPEPSYVYRPTVVEPDNAYQPTAVVEPPIFVMPPELGFYVAVGVPYDLFFVNNVYYVCRGDIWYSSTYYNGPWRRIYYSEIPFVFSRYPFERIRYYRDHYYNHYRRYGSWDGHRHFLPDRHALTGGNYNLGRHAYSRPDFPARLPGDRPAYNRPDRNGSTYGNYYGNTGRINPARRPDDRPAFTRPYGNGSPYSGRPAYARPYSPVRRPGAGSALVNPSGSLPGSGDRPVYHRPYGSGQTYDNHYAYTGSNGASRNTIERPAYYRASGAGQTFGGRPAAIRSSLPARDTSARDAGRVPNSFGGTHSGWQGHGR